MTDSQLKSGEPTPTDTERINALLAFLKIVTLYSGLLKAHGGKQFGFCRSALCCRGY
jgi:hypothetical protein